MDNLFTRVKHYVQECVFSQENRVKTQIVKRMRVGGEHSFFSFLGLVVGINHMSHKVTRVYVCVWFTYISLLLSVRCVYACVRVCSLCVFSFKFHLTLMP